MTDGVPIRIGTRGSPLALVQARWVAAELEARGVATELVQIRTSGDDRAPDTAWGEGAFVTAIEAALLEGRVDAAVHSAKDVPTEEEPRLAIAAWTAREDPRDALVCRVRGTTLETLPDGSRVGTDSPRRTAFLRARRPDLRLHTLSGNVDTRLRKLDAGESDALVLAVAGLTRLGHADRIDEILPLDLAVPAPGQGALAIQVRADDPRARAALELLDDHASRAAVEAERAFLAATGGGCRSPIGALGEVRGDTILLRVAAERAPVLDGRALGLGGILRMEASGQVAGRDAIAAALAARVVAARTRPRVLVTRPGSERDPVADALRASGMEPVGVAMIQIDREPAGGALDAALAAGDRYDWIVVTSANGAAAAAEALARVGRLPARARWAAVGPATARALERAGIPVGFVPARATGSDLGHELPLETGDRILLARGDLADATLPGILARRGADVTEVVAYTTIEGPAASAPVLEAALAEGPIDALVLASGSAVRGLRLLTPASQVERVLATPAVCIGPVSAGVARETGFRAVREAATPDPTALVRAVVQAIVASASDAGGGPTTEPIPTPAAPPAGVTSPGGAA
jgi:hydroxymethylbilane synthase